jgi:GNAT superfamily N-acetyltransferase
MQVMDSMSQRPGPSRREPVGPWSRKLRELRETDLDAISRIHWRACRIAYRFMGWSYGEDEVRRWYAGKLPQWDWGRVACAGGSVVGYLAAIGAHVDQLFVDPDHQGAGIGSALLRAMLARGPWPATLQVFALNAPARAFFERFGFRQVDAWWNEQEEALELLYRLEEPSLARSTTWFRRLARRSRRV